jgi:7-cyano-7-deazaguanine synthase
MKKTVVITSGGMDSAVLLAHMRLRLGPQNVRALSINYGQRHKIELEYACQFAKSIGIEWACADLSNLGPLLPGSSQTDPKVAVPHGHYAEESMKQTVVPNRNMILLAIAIGHAIGHRCDTVSYAAHAGDHAIYPDCRPIFADALNVAAQLADWHIVTIEKPFIHMTKAEIVSKGVDVGVDFSKTYSCYEGKEKHCGKCGTCVERREAFERAGVQDPTEYVNS